MTGDSDLDDLYEETKASLEAIEEARTELEEYAEKLIEADKQMAEYEMRARDILRELERRRSQP